MSCLPLPVIKKKNNNIKIYDSIYEIALARICSTGADLTVRVGLSDLKLRYAEFDHM